MGVTLVQWGSWPLLDLWIFANCSLYETKIGCIQFLWAGAKQFKFSILLCAEPLSVPRRAWKFNFLAFFGDRPSNQITNIPTDDQEILGLQVTLPIIKGRDVHEIIKLKHIEYVDYLSIYKIMIIILARSVDMFYYLNQEKGQALKKYVYKNKTTFQKQPL